ncbi:MAG: ATP-binding protein [Clostridia bacterium]|nr:ATP-binding protein [Clostridia bacterium]
MPELTHKVPKRILSNLLTSVSAGVVPRSGAPYLAIGRKNEIAALLKDLESVNEGNGTLRFLIGPYGSGKSFLIQLIRGYALDNNFITADADLSPERRLYGTNGTGVATYRELLRNLGSKTCPDGGALSGILMRWVDGLKTALLEQGTEPDERALLLQVTRSLQALENQVGGFDFAKVVTEYYRAQTQENNDLRTACLQWLRGEFTTRTEAKRALGFTVSQIITDENWYGFIKLWAETVRLMGYRGLVIFIDECVNLYKIAHRVTRENNYEKILSMFNDTLQGKAPGLGIVLGGTPQFLEDTRRGLFSYEALRSRLCDSRFNSDQFVNLIGPVIRIRRLSDDELFALLQRVNSLYEQQYAWKPRLSESDMSAFLNVCLERAGANMLITPREILRDYLTILNLLMQNPDSTYESIAASAIHLTPAPNAEAESAVPANDLSAFDPADLIF